MSRPRRRDERYRRGKPMRTPPERLMSHECQPCGKRAWATRQAAKRATRVTQNTDGGGALHAYRCPHDERTWHVGHMGTDKSRSYYREKAER